MLTGTPRPPIRALIAACAVDSGLTEQEWAEQLDSDLWSQGERNALFNTALELNIGTPDRQARSRVPGPVSSTFEEVLKRLDEVERPRVYAIEVNGGKRCVRHPAHEPQLD
jgi:hypothetical protein